MRWLITGAGGMLGTDLRALLATRENDHVTALTRSDLDVSDPGAVAAAVAGHDVVVNAAAHTRVDDAEAERDAAFAVNATGAGLLAEASASSGARFVQLSTDYVFDGTATTPYAENAPTHPLSVYGASKAEGERLALAGNPDGTLVLRTAWLYGAAGDNFVAAMLRRGDAGVSVVADQYGQPTWTVDLARQIVAAIAADVAPGIYHATNSGATSRYEFAREIFALSGLDADLVSPTTGDAFVRPAPRPAYSVLGHDAWSSSGIAEPRDWREALADYLS